MTLTRPAYELRIGTSSLREKISANVKVDGETILLNRHHLKETQREKSPHAHINDFSAIDDDVQLVNGLAFADERLDKALRKLSRPGMAVMCGSRVVAAYLKPEAFSDSALQKAIMSANNVSEAIAKSASEKLQSDEVYLIEYPWELIVLNSKLISAEFKSIRAKEWEGEIDPSVVIYGDRQNIYLAKGSFVEAHTVLDARNGPIYIGENTYVQSLTRISGPTYVGRDCIIFGGQLREGCSIGDVCRVGGEVEETIFHGYSNKRHYGFVGHSYIGEWVNLGAGTTNSDLKNTYGMIRMEINGQKRDTGRMFVGAFIGDHVKTAVGTYIFSGKKIGVSSHIYGIIPEDIPSFTAYAKTLGARPTEIYLDSAIETARRVMSRRKVFLTKAYEDMLRKVFEITEQDRSKAGVLKERLSI